MRLWLATTEMAPFAGGIGVYVHHTGAMLAARGVDLTVFFHDVDTERTTVARVDGYRLIRFHNRDLAGDPLPRPELHGPLLAAFQMCELLKSVMAQEGAPDIVEVQDYGALGYFFLKHRLMEMGAEAPRVVLTAHRPYVHCAATDNESLVEHRTVFLGDAERWCYAACDAVLTPSRFMIEALRSPGMDFPIRDEDVHLVRNPFDPGSIAAARADDLVLPQRLELRRRQFTLDEPVLFFGKLQDQKGPWELTASLASLAGEGRSQPLWMWGRDALHSPTGTTTYDFLSRRYPHQFGTGLVRYFGDYSLGTLREMCAGHPVCVVPYRAENLPYAVIEMALCGGLPLVASRGGQLELIPETLRPLLTAEFTRPDQLGDRIAALKALSAQARRRVSETLKAEVLRQTAYPAVLAQKLATFDRVRLRSTDANYPFVHGETKVFGRLAAEAQAQIADAIPQRGINVAVTHADGERPAAREGLISVIIPYYEMSAYIDETLQSVETQTHPDVEVVIVDDGSPSPEARAKLTEILRRPRRFPTRVVRKYNGGLSDARNAGAKLARGEYLYFLDADDLIHPSTLAHGLAVLRRFPNVAYIGAWLREFEGGDRQWIVWDVDSPYIGFHNLQICSFLIRAEAWLRFGVNDPDMSLGMEDYESHIRMFATGVRGVALPRTYFHYRIRAGSMSRRFKPAAMAHLYRRIALANPQFYARYGAQLAGMAAENGHGAFAGPPTEQTAANAALFGQDAPVLTDVEHELERWASRERLSQALRGRVQHGGAAWDYVAGRLLLALGAEPGWAERLLVAAAERDPSNGWFRLYAVTALLRAGRFTRARELASGVFYSVCNDQLDAVMWIAGLESLRGFPHVNRGLRALLTPVHGHRLPQATGIAGDGQRGGADDACDPAFGETRNALDVLRQTLATNPGPQGVDDAHRQGAARAVLLAAAGVMSREAAAAMIAVWLAIWIEAGLVGEHAGERLSHACANDPDLVGLHFSAPASCAFWGRSAAAFRRDDLARQQKAGGLSPEEQEDVGLWLDVSGAAGSEAAALHPRLLSRLKRVMLRR